MTAEAKTEIVEATPQEVAPAITPMQMLQIAVDQGADLDKLTKLMDLQERWEASQARKAYVAALAAFKADPPKVIKNKTVRYGSGNGATSYDHATLAQVANAVAPALAEHGLSHSWSTEQSEKGISVTCTLTHRDGHSECVTLAASADNSGSKNSIQAIGSTVTYLQRYTLLSITGLATEDMDDDGAGSDPAELISAEQKDELIALIRDIGGDDAPALTTSTLKYFDLVSLDAMPASLFERVKVALEKKRKKQDG